MLKASLLKWAEGLRCLLLLWLLHLPPHLPLPLRLRLRLFLSAPVSASAPVDPVAPAPVHNPDLPVPPPADPVPQTGIVAALKKIEQEIEAAVKAL